MALLLRNLNAIGVGIGVYSTVYLFSETVYGGVWVTGGSMRPTLNPNPDLDHRSDFCIIRKWRYQPARGDIVSARSPHQPNKSVIKRIIGLEGDWIKASSSDKIIIVPKGHCWLEGDNKSGSVDSNRYGPVPLNLIQGKATLIIFPQERSWKRAFSKLESKDEPERRADIDEYVDWARKRQQDKIQKRKLWCFEHICADFDEWFNEWTQKLILAPNNPEAVKPPTTASFNRNSEAVKFPTESDSFKSNFEENSMNTIDQKFNTKQE